MEKVNKNAKLDGQVPDLVSEVDIIITESSRWGFESFKIEKKLSFVVESNDLSIKSNAVDRE